MCFRPMNAKTTTNTLVMENHKVQNKNEYALVSITHTTDFKKVLLTLVFIRSKPNTPEGARTPNLRIRKAAICIKMIHLSK